MEISHQRTILAQVLTLSGNMVRGHHAAKKALHIASRQEAVSDDTEMRLVFMCSSDMLETGQ